MCGDDLNMYKTQIDGIQTGTNTPVPVNVDSTGDIQVDVKSIVGLGNQAATQATGTTTASYVAALTWSCKSINRKTIIVTNTHATLTMSYRIRGYAKSGSTGYDEIQAATTLAASTCDPHTITDEYDVITVEVIDGTGHATYTVDYVGGA